MFLVTAIHITKRKVFTFLYTIIAFIFAGFRIKDIVRAMLTVYWYIFRRAFSVNHVQKMRGAESSGVKKNIIK